MASKGINIAEQCHVVNMIAPVDVNGAGATADYVTLSDYQHIDIVLTLGVTGAACGILLYEAADSAGATKTAIGFQCYKEETAAGDTLAAPVAVGTTGFNTGTANGITYVIPVDASTLTDGYPWVGVTVADPSAATLVSCVGILSGARYQAEITPTAIV